MTGAAVGSVLVVRQPVLDGSLDLQGYRLRARASGEVADAFSEFDAGRTAAKVIHDAFLEMDVWAVTGGRPAHLECTRDLLAHGTARLLHPAGTVVELAAETGADPEIRAAAADLRDEGYRVALRGVGPGDTRVGVLPADLAKVPAGPDAAVAVRHARRHGLRVILTEVADPAAYLRARALDPDGYEGPFLQSPALVRGRRLEGSRLGYLRLLQAAHRPELDFADMEERIKRDVSLSWKFLNYTNAAFFGWRARMASIRQGLVLLGEDGVRRWVSLIAMRGLANGLPMEVVTAVLSRARFAERVAARAPQGLSPLHAFLTGMFSLLDTLVDEPLDALLSQVAVPDEVAAAILRREGELGALLGLVERYERADWEGVDAVATGLGLESADLGECYVDALSWVSEEAEAQTGRATGG